MGSMTSGLQGACQHDYKLGSVINENCGNPVIQRSYHWIATRIARGTGCLAGQRDPGWAAPFLLCCGGWVRLGTEREKVREGR